MHIILLTIATTLVSLACAADCTYSQSSGQLNCTTGSTTYGSTGYSGARAGGGYNNPDMQHLRNVGPIPRGTYDIGGCRNSVTRDTVTLTPRATTNTHGRDNFRIHGGNGRGTASQGCIIVPRTMRRRICNDGGGTLRVTR